MAGALSILRTTLFLTKDICARSTRQSNLLHLPARRTEVAKRSFYYHEVC